MLKHRLMAIMIGAFPCTTAWAAPDAPHDILVTAQKREERASDVGVALTLFSGEQLRSIGVIAPEEIALLTPGLTINDSAAQGSPVYTLRGVGFANPYANASSAVGIAFDEVPLPYPVMSRGAVFDVARVEILKGPQGDLFGRNTTGGQISFISNRPTREFAAGIDARYGRFDLRDIEAYVSGPVTSGIQFRVAGRLLRSDGWQRSLTRPDDRKLGGFDQSAIRAQFNIDLASGGALLLSAHRITDRSDNLAPTPFDGRDIGLPTAQPLPTIGAPIFSSGDNRAADWTPAYRPKRDNRLTGASARLDLPLGSLLLTSLSAYDHFDQRETNDWDGAMIRDAASLNATDIDSFSQEVRWSNSGGNPLQWLVGGYFSRDSLDENYHYFIEDSFYAAALGINLLNTRYRQTTHSLSGFGHVEWRIGQKLTLIGGLRYTDERRKFSGCTYDVDGSVAAAANFIITPFLIVPAGLPDPGPMAPGSCAVYDDRPSSPTYGNFAQFTDSIATRRWMWKAGANYAPSDNALLYASLSSGFKSGGFNGGNVNIHSQLTAYRPERLTAYEFGFKLGDLLSGLRLEGAAFHYDYRDKQEQDYAVTFVGNIGALTNIPRSRVNGAELNLNWQPFTDLAIDMAGAWLDTKVTRWSAVDLASVYPTVEHFDASGIRLPNAPRWSLNVTPEYRRNVGSRLQASVAFDAAYRSATTGGARLSSATESYWVFNGHLGIAAQDGRWSVMLWGRNIFDRAYFLSAYFGNGTYVRVNAPPATYGIGLHLKM